MKKIVLAFIAAAALAIASAGHAQAGGDIDFDAVKKEGGVSGKALLKYDGNGFSVVEWIEKLKNGR